MCGFDLDIGRNSLVRDKFQEVGFHELSELSLVSSPPVCSAEL